MEKIPPLFSDSTAFLSGVGSKREELYHKGGLTINGLYWTFSRI